MALLGEGVLAIWNGITDIAEADFVAWHVREHIPERVGIAGFLRGRRYVAIDGHPKFFNFYETETTSTLVSPAYRQRLDNPTAWTRRVVANFRDTTRTICEVVASLGCGEGCWVETIRFAARVPTSRFASVIERALLPNLMAQPGIIAAHLLHGQPVASQNHSAEKALRSEPDRIAEWVMLIEAIEAECLTALRGNVASQSRLDDHGFDASADRGIYRLQFALAKADLEAGQRAH